MYNSHVCELGQEIQKLGHRGFGKTEYNEDDKFYIENTIYAFQKAEKHNLKAIELDIICTKDKHLVVFHDFFIDGKFIHDLSTDDFLTESQKHCRLIKPELTNTTDIQYFPTTLFRILQSFPNILFNIEIKYPENNRHYIYREDLIKLILKEIKGLHNKIIFSSFDKQIILILSKYKINSFFLAEDGSIEDHLIFTKGKYISGLILPEELYLHNILVLQKYRKTKGSKFLGTYQSVVEPLKMDDLNEPDFRIVDQ